MEHIDTSSFKFLVMQIQVPLNPLTARNDLKHSVEQMLRAIDAVPMTSHQKLRLYKQGMCPLLTWSFLVEVFPISFFKKVIQPRVTSFLKKWSGLARSANPSLLFLSRCRDGLGSHININVQETASLSQCPIAVFSRSCGTRRGSTSASDPEECSAAELQASQAVLDQNRHLSRKALVKVTRALVATEEDKAISTSFKDLPQQGRMNRQFEGNEAAMWATCVTKLPPEPLKFVLNASVESLPTNANLHKSSLLHILNECPTAMALRRYATRHDEVLCHLVTFIQHHLPPSCIMTADLPDCTYSFPQHITPTKLRPDVVWWSDQLKVVWLLELTCSFETTMDQAHHLKEAKYVP